MKSGSRFILLDMHVRRTQEGCHVVQRLGSRSKHAYSQVRCRAAVDQYGLCLAVLGLGQLRLKDVDDRADSIDMRYSCMALLADCERHACKLAQERRLLPVPSLMLSDGCSAATT